MNTKEELEKLAPMLAKLEKKEPFSVPDGYFMQLNDAVQERIARKKSWSERLSTALDSLFLPKVYRPALALLVVGIGFGYFSIQQQRSSEQALSNAILIELSDQELIEAVELNEVAMEDDQTQLEEYIINNVEEETILENI